MLDQNLEEQDALGEARKSLEYACFQIEVRQQVRRGQTLIESRKRYIAKRDRITQTILSWVYPKKRPRDL